MNIFLIFYLFITYLITSIPFGYIIGKILGKDVRREGSGNIGATNVARTVGKIPGLLVLILDALKGFIPVYFAINYFDLYFSPKDIGLIAIFAIIGHCFSIFMKFKGGKGVATGLGVLFAISLKSALLTATLWLGVFLVSGYVSLASILAATISGFFVFGMTMNPVYSLATFISSFIIVVKHIDNIERLLSGKEHKFLHRCK